MITYEEETTADLPARPIFSGCISFVFLLVFIIFIAGTVYIEAAEPAPTYTPPPSATFAQMVLARVTATTTAVDTPTLAPTATATQTPTPQPTPTNTDTPTPTLTPTEVPTQLPFGPTYTPEPPTATPLPLPTPQDGISQTVRVPILMYHYISVPPEDADVYRTDLSVSPDNFRAQMTYLAQNGYTPIDFYDLSLAITGHQALPPRPVIITLDDAYRDQYENAFPVLREFGFTATIFVVTEFIDRGFESYVNWDMIAEMAAAGIRFEPHSRTHADLTERDPDFLIWEMLGPQE
jgi:hypothetical protein